MNSIKLLEQTKTLSQYSHKSQSFLSDRSLVQIFILPRLHELKIKFDIENHVEVKKIIGSKK